MAEIYQQRIASLYESLQAEETKTEAAERLRTLVSQITLQPADGELTIILRGDLAAMLGFAVHNKKNAMHHPDAGVLEKFLVQDTLVAGAGLVLKLQQSQVENKASLNGYFSKLFLHMADHFTHAINKPPGEF